MIEIRNAEGAGFPTSVEDELINLIQSDREADHETFRKLHSTCNILRNLLQGADLIVARGTHERLCLHPEGDTNASVILTYGLEQFSVACFVPPSIHWLPKVEGKLCFSLSCEKTAAVSLARTLIKLSSLESERCLFKYINESPLADAEVIEGLATCPFCNIEFDPGDADAWNGTSHVFCEQKILLQITERSKMTLRGKMGRLLNEKD